MTDEKLQELAKIVLANDERLMLTTVIIRNTMEMIFPLIDPEKIPLALLHNLEEVDAVANLSAQMRAQARKYFDLPLCQEEKTPNG